MASEVDLDKLVQTQERESDSESAQDLKAPSFDPMRRKLKMRMDK